MTTTMAGKVIISMILGGEAGYWGYQGLIGNLMSPEPSIRDLFPENPYAAIANVSGYSINQVSNYLYNKYSTSSYTNDSNVDTGNSQTESKYSWVTKIK